MSAWTTVMGVLASVAECKHGRVFTSLKSRCKTCPTLQKETTQKITSKVQDVLEFQIGDTKFPYDMNKPLTILNFEFSGTALGFGAFFDVSKNEKEKIQNRSFFIHLLVPTIGGNPLGQFRPEIFFSRPNGSLRQTPVPTNKKHKKSIIVKRHYKNC